MHCIAFSDGVGGASCSLAVRLDLDAMVNILLDEIPLREYACIADVSEASVEISGLELNLDGGARPCPNFWFDCLKEEGTISVGSTEWPLRLSNQPDFRIQFPWVLIQY